VTRIDDQDSNPSSEAHATSYSVGSGGSPWWTGEVMKLGHEAYHCSFSTGVKRKWSHTFTPTVYPSDMYMDNHTFTLTISATYITTQAIKDYFCSS